MGGSDVMAHDRPARRAVTHAGSRGRLDLDVLAAAASDVCILISGTEGTRDVARRIHGLTRGRPGRFRSIDCGWPETLLEEQLFHGIGPGSTGTVFLEEVGRLSAGLQGRLLAAVDAPAYLRGVRLGRARVIASTSEPLLQRALEGTFNERLFYRLNAIHVVMPPAADDWGYQ
jgi:DNA-binding NtrC family response regulator